jgi:hypothetical protein
VLVFQMGKVASTSIARAIHRALPGLEVRQLHYLSETGLQRIERWLAFDAQVDPVARASTEAQIAEAREIRRRLTAAAPRWRVVTLTREPLGHLVSVLFHSLRMFSLRAGATEGGIADRAARLQDYVNRSWAERRAFVDRGAPDSLPEDALFVAPRWFSDELQAALGIDVYASPFEHVCGVTRLRGAAVDLLCCRMEDLGWTGATIGHLLVGRPLQLRRENTSAQASALRAEFLRTWLPPADLVAAAYETAFARHFYTPAERDLFRARWSARRGSEPV